MALRLARPDLLADNFYAHDRRRDVFFKEQAGTTGTADAVPGEGTRPKKAGAGGAGDLFGRDCGDNRGHALFVVDSAGMGSAGGGRDKPGRLFAGFLGVQREPLVVADH